MREPRSLRTRLLLSLAVPVTVLAAVAGWAAWQHARGFATETYDRWIGDSAVALSQLAVRRDGRVVVDVPLAAEHMLASDQRDRIYWRIETVDGRFLAGHRDLPTMPRALVPGAAPVCVDREYRGEPVRVASYRASDPPIVVAVAETTRKRASLRDELLADAVLPALGILLLSVVAVFAGVNRGLAPLDALAMRLRARRPDSDERIDPADAPREVRPLVEALDDLLERQGAMLDAQRRFTADAAHQLRTPLTGLRTQAELALRDPDPVAARAALERLLPVTQDASRLVAQLLATARAEDATATPAPRETLDLAALAREVTADWVPRALAADLDLGFDGPDAAVPIHGDRLLLREALGNLLDNAIKYCPRGSHVTVRVAADATGTGPTLAVVDDGPGVPASER
ncbi:MAG: sensor histidine kinase N-terminal domain-containing protein [Burkholderiales bacterium]|nr:sensor histidine kinase N-terminal domain-containing protein [Burkholderiales bacterium]